MKREKPTKCRKCRHNKTRHSNGKCFALRSCGPSGTFRCGCEGFESAEAK